MKEDDGGKPCSSTLMRVDNVGRTYSLGDVSVEVLRGFSLDIQVGELLAIVGPSGSGKSTVLNIIGGLDQPSIGTVKYGQFDVSHAQSDELTRFRRQKIGFVFQFYNLVPNLTARENVLIATELSADPLDVDEVLDMFGLQERKHHFPSQLSGGEQQRVAIARAVAKNPELILCDEPTGALDYQTGKLVLRLLVDLNRNLAKTIVMITHNGALAKVADRVVHLRSGEITEIVSQTNPLSPEEVTW